MLLKFFHKHLSFLVLLCLLSCHVSSTKKEIDLSHLTTEDTELLIERVQGDVNKKMPFQGSLIHQHKCDTLLALKHNVVGALQEKSTPHTKIGDYHIAFSLLEEAAAVNPQDALYYYSWLLLYYFRDYERALDRLSQFDDFTPNETDVAWGENVNYLKGLAYKQLGQYVEAIKEFSKAIADEGDNVDLYAFVYRGISYLHKNEIALAVKDFDKAIQIYDKCTAAYFWKAEAYLKQGSQQEAILLLEKAKQLLEQGYYKSDAYMELFDIPVLAQVEDKLLGLK